MAPLRGKQPLTHCDLWPNIARCGEVPLDLPVLAGLALAFGCAAAEAEKAQPSWTMAMAASCPRCVSASPERHHQWAHIPERAVIYSFTGEFAHATDWAMVNLDNGDITSCRLTFTRSRVDSVGCNHTTTTSTALESLRASAEKLWRSEPPLPSEIGFAPGTVEEAYVVAGPRMVRFSRWTKSEDYLVTALKTALGDEGEL